MTDFAQTHTVASDIVSYLQREHSDLNPMEATAAVAVTLGSMVGTLNELGLTKQGRTGALLEHLFKIAEQTAISGAAT